MNARDEILHRIRTALADRPALEPVARDYRTAGASGVVDVDRLVDRLEDYRANVHRTDTASIRETIDGLLSGSVVVPDGFPIEWLPAGLDVLRDDPPLRAEQLDSTSAVVTTCMVAVAETGTIVLDHGPGQGRRALTLVPDHHVVVVRVEQVVAGVPDAVAVAVLDAVRPQTWISGPSATSDIELSRVEGVHGPRRLDVILLA
ncbi:MAG: LutC/YkgG family protein [Jatrophihabitans sp.]